MNVRKPADYSQLFAALDAVLTAEQAQTQRCYAIGRLIALRPEKGAAVAAASYLKARYPDIPGLSPRNLRRMRDFYRVYVDHPSLLKEAMETGWTQNVVILEACQQRNGPGTSGLLRNSSGQKQRCGRQLIPPRIWSLCLMRTLLRMSQKEAANTWNRKKQELKRRHASAEMKLP